MGKVLGLQAEATAMLVNLSGSAGNPIFHEVTGIEMNAGLGRVDLQGSTGLSFKGLSSQTQTVSIFCDLQR
jgi:hypothetical protein